MRPEFCCVLECRASDDRRVHHPAIAGLALDGRSKLCVGWLLSTIAREQEHWLHVDDADAQSPNQFGDHRDRQYPTEGQPVAVRPCQTSSRKVNIQY